MKAPIGFYSNKPVGKFYWVKLRTTINENQYWTEENSGFLHWPLYF